jgi:hypothetical protein
MFNDYRSRHNHIEIHFADEDKVLDKSTLFRASKPIICVNFSLKVKKALQMKDNQCLTCLMTVEVDIAILQYFLLMKIKF